VDELSADPRKNCNKETRLARRVKICGRLRAIATVLVCAAGIVTLGGCGQKGDLYLPDKSTGEHGRR
jgi:hypothetical protein